MHPILAGANVQQCADYCATHRASTSKKPIPGIWKFQNRRVGNSRRFIGFFDVFDVGCMLHVNFNLTPENPFCCSFFE